MRCKLCDYSPDSPNSMYHDSLALPQTKKELYVDNETGETLCNCFRSDVYYGTYSENSDELSLDTTFDDVLDLEFDSPKKKEDADEVLG